MYAIRSYYGVEVILVGDENKIKSVSSDNNLSLNGISIRHADTVIEICDDPTMILKEKSDCSMAVGMKMLANDEGA